MAMHLESCRGGGVPYGGGWSQPERAGDCAGVLGQSGCLGGHGVLLRWCTVLEDDHFGMPLSRKRPLLSYVETFPIIALLTAWKFHLQTGKPNDICLQQLTLGRCHLEILPETYLGTPAKRLPTRIRDKAKYFARGSCTVATIAYSH